jgi:hypothetical protein
MCSLVPLLAKGALEIPNFTERDDMAREIIENISVIWGFKHTTNVRSTDLHNGKILSRISRYCYWRVWRMYNS